MEWLAVDEKTLTECHGCSTAKGSQSRKSSHEWESGQRPNGPDEGRRVWCVAVTGTLWGSGGLMDQWSGSAPSSQAGGQGAL